MVDAYVEKEYPEEVANGGKEDKAALFMIQTYLIAFQLIQWS